MTTDTMYDSDNIDDIPDTAQVVMFYNDGEPGTPTPAQLSRFSGKPLVSITRKVGVKAKVADIEPGCIWPPEAARAQFEQGDSDTAYCSWNNHAAVITALQGLTYSMLIANYDGVAEIPVVPGVNVVGKQYANSTTSGGHFDLSIINQAWLTGGTVTDVPGKPADDSEPVEAAGGKFPLEAPIVDAVWVSGGCYMVDAKGGVYVRDAGVYHGSIPGLQPPVTLHADIIAILVQDHTGYTLVGEDGGTFRFGAGPDVQAL